MIIKTITYTEKRNFGDRTYENGEYRAEAVIEDGEDEDEAAALLRATVTGWLEGARYQRERERNIGFAAASGQQAQKQTTDGDDFPF